MMQAGAGCGGVGRRYRVMVAEDHVLFAEALAANLVEHGPFEVVGHVTAGELVVPGWRRYRPDVVVTDLELGDVDGVDAARAILRDDPTACVVVLSAFGSRARVRAAIDAGVAGFITKSLPGPRICELVLQAVEAGAAFDPTATRALVEDLRGRPELTGRQVEVLARRSRGETYSEIAAALFVGQATVKTHVRDACRRLGVSNSAAAVYRARELGLLSGP